MELNGKAEKLKRLLFAARVMEIVGVDKMEQISKDLREAFEIVDNMFYDPKMPKDFLKNS